MKYVKNARRRTFGNLIFKLMPVRAVTALAMVMTMAALITSATPASAAPNCLQNVFGSKKLNCTANDVTISSVNNVRDLSGNPLHSCIPGSHFSFVADFTVVTTATSRENIGIYFQTAGGSTALSGTCSDNIVSPLHTAANPLDTVLLGSATYNNVDPAPDNCGDTTSAHPEVITIEVDNVLCQAAAGSNPPVVALPNCTSWQQPNGAVLCESDPTSGWPWVSGALPGTSSKCSCDNTASLPIAVQTPTTTVKKSCTTPNSTGLNTSCSLDDTGSPGTVTYTVEVDNTSNFGTLTLNQLCDDKYGNIAKGNNPSCAAGTATATPVSCTLPATIAAGGNFQCTFTASQPENSIVMDTATANGVGADGTTPFSGTSNSVTVTAGEAASTATTAKTLVSTTAGCATVRYGVDVHNTSLVDEVLTLSALSDSQYGDITTLGKGSGGSVLGTTCGVTGLGTLSGSPGAGALGSIAIGGDYKCQFDAQFCGTLTTITTGPTTSCTGIQTTDVVTPTLTGDEGEKVDNTGGSLTVSECFVSSAQ